MLSLSSIPRVPLAALPTPLEDAPRLARHCGLKRLLIKRDDQTGLAMGGNKARKLEYDFAEVVAKGCDVVLTIGGTQSNHARMTAAAARKLGLDVKLVLGGPRVTAPQGNILLERILGAEVRYLVDNDENDALASAMEQWAEELRRAGRHPCCLPIGGSTGLGAIGYVRAMEELAGQFGMDPVQIVIAVGSCGTFAGTILGASVFMPRARVIGISVSRTAAAIAARTAELMQECAGIMQIADVPGPRDVVSYDRYHHAYGVSSPAGRDAILAAARLEGLLLDPIYTGKSMAGLIDLARTDGLDPSVPVIFIHTGGLPILFASAGEFQDTATFTEL
jgi:D-cysteine desulfhydrase family pyridoxal phosphate-dependent enzyme